MAKTTVKWFAPGEKLGWTKEASQTKRRQVALRHRGGKFLAAARALQALSNVTKDPETKQKARADAKYFFAQHRKKEARTRK